MSSHSSQQLKFQHADITAENADRIRKVSHNTKHQDDNVDGITDSSFRKISQQGHSPERMRRISQYSKEVTNTGHSFQEKDERFRRISQYSRTSEGGEVSEKQRKISHYSRDGVHLKDVVMRGYGKTRAGTRREHERYSVVTSGGIEVPRTAENTFKLGPDRKFPHLKVRNIIEKVLQENLKDKNYEKHLMASRCLLLSEIIKEKVHQLRLDRFKIVSIVLIGENKSQKMLVSSRCLWNDEQDNFASCNFSQGNLCAVGMVFAVYQE